MGFRFYRYKGNEKVYQCAYVDVKELNEHGVECRLPILIDAASKEDATVFPIEDWALINFLEDWFCLCAEDAEDDEE